jgi:hypothetical protein
MRVRCHSKARGSTPVPRQKKGGSHMYRIVAIALLAFMQSGGLVSASSSCSGLPAIVSVAVKGMNASNGLNRYELTGTVVNRGAAQPSNTLQSVDIFSKGTKLDTRSIPPLGPGESYVFSYVSERSSDAGSGTTKLRFQFDVAQPASGGSQDCNAKSDGYSVTF